MVIPAAGSSKRMRGFSKRKPFILLGGKPIIGYVLDIFKKLAGVKEIILVVNGKDLKSAKRYFQSGRIKIVRGGRTRKDSVYNGLRALGGSPDIILIHDGARPFVTGGLIMRSVRAAARFGAAVAAVPVIPTIKKADKNGFVDKTLDRKSLWEIQTPQAFKRDLIIKAFRQSGRSGEEITDDAMLVEKAGRRVKLIMGSYRNIKITSPQDLAIAEALLRNKYGKIKNTGRYAHRPGVRHS